MTKKLNIILILLLSSFIANAQKKLTWVSGTTDYSQALETLMESASDNDNIEFQKGKVYPFKSTIKILKPLNFVSTQSGQKATLRMTRDSRHFIDLTSGIRNDRRVTIKDLIIDGNGNVEGNFESSLVYSRGKKLTIKNSHLRDGKNGIRAEIGTALHGLNAENVQFHEIDRVCILLLNRKSSVDRITAFTEKAKVINCKFFGGFERGIISDAGNDFKPYAGSNSNWVSQKAKIREKYTTNLKNTTIRGNTFTNWKKWCVGLVQAENVTIDNNTGTGPANDAAASNTFIHIEQFTKNIRITNNTINYSTAKAKSFIDMAGGEAKRRFRNTGENPILKDLPDGNIGGNCKRNSFSNNTTESLDCRPRPHTYGQRRIYIYSNTFNGNNNAVQLEFGIAFHEGENIFIGRNANGVLNKNTWNLRNSPNKGKIKITNAHRGVCNIKIADNSPDIKYFRAKNNAFNQSESTNKKGVSLNGNMNCIEVNSSTNTTSVDNFENILNESFFETDNDFTFYPNPAKNSLNISTGNNTEPYKLEVYNTMGALIKNISVSKGTPSYRLDINSLTKGIYILNYVDKGHSLRKTFMVE